MIAAYAEPPGLEVDCASRGETTLLAADIAVKFRLGIRSMIDSSELPEYLGLGRYMDVQLCPSLSTTSRLKGYIRRNVRRAQHCFDAFEAS